MIHKFELPPVTYSRLKDIVLLQMDFLYYAAFHAEFDPKSSLLKESCIEYFTGNDLQHSEFKGRGEKVVGWLWRGPDRLEKLKEFALACREASKDQKAIHSWYDKLYQTVKELIDPNNRTVYIHNFFDMDPSDSQDEQDKKDGKNEKDEKNENPRWQQCASKFFLYFYDAYLGKSGSEKKHLTFDADLFTDQGAKDYGRQDFLKAFFSYNSHLEICPFCDEMRIYTLSTAGIYADIDHFLPKKLYPYLACHPYNLVPACHACNSGNKNQDNPLKDFDGQQCSRALFPYSETSLGQDTYVDVTISWLKRGEPPLININGFIPRPDSKAPSQDLEAGIELLGQLYNIPTRWKIPQNWEELTESRALVVSETLFRRMHHFLGHSPEVFPGSDSTQKVYNALKQLLYYLNHDDHGKDPFAFVMTWILAALLKKEIQPALNKKDEQLPPSVREVVSWFGQSLEENTKRDNRVEELLSFLQPKEKET